MNDLGGFPKIDFPAGIAKGHIKVSASPLKESEKKVVLPTYYDIRFILMKEYSYKVQLDYICEPSGLLTIIATGNIPIDDPVLLKVFPDGGKSSEVLTFTKRGSENWVNLQDLIPPLPERKRR